MTEERTAGKFYFIGNDLWLDFINTQVVAEGRPVDRLTSFADLIAWLEEAKVLDGRQATCSNRRSSTCWPGSAVRSSI